MNPRFLCGVNLPAQVHLFANSPSHFSAWGLMSFHVEGECISSVCFSSCGASKSDSSALKTLKTIKSVQ